jgi:hypothetical protein
LRQHPAFFHGLQAASGRLGHGLTQLAAHRLALGRVGHPETAVRRPAPLVGGGYLGRVLGHGLEAGGGEQDGQPDKDPADHAHGPGGCGAVDGPAWRGDGRKIGQ